MSEKHVAPIKRSYAATHPELLRVRQIARIQVAVLTHIWEGPQREAAALRNWKSKQPFIEYPANLTPDQRLRQA